MDSGATAWKVGPTSRPSHQSSGLSVPTQGATFWLETSERDWGGRRPERVSSTPTNPPTHHTTVRPHLREATR